MKHIALVFIFLFSSLSFSQTIVQIDSVAKVMCDNLPKYKEIKNDPLKLNTLYEKELYPYLGTLEESKAQEVGKKIYYRLQRNCFRFRELLDRLNPPVGETERSLEKPKPDITDDDLIKFKKTKAFMYTEVDGQVTNVTLQDGLWVDNFADGTYSKLIYKWINKNEFELVFIESNNETRANFSVKGDRLVYSILFKKPDHYILSVNIFGQNVYEEFKLFY